MKKKNKKSTCVKYSLYSDMVLEVPAKSPVTCFDGNWYHVVYAGVCKADIAKNTVNSEKVVTVFVIL